MEKYFHPKIYLNFIGRKIYRFAQTLAYISNPDAAKDRQLFKPLLKSINYQAVSNIAKDTRKFAEHGEPTILDETMNEIIDRKRFSGKRVLEIGPKWGHNALWIDKNIRPSEFVMVDLPITKEGLKLWGESFQQNAWLSKMQSPYKIIYKNFLVARELLTMEPFDLILCAGVLYHNHEQLKIFNFLRRLLKDDGMLILQTSIWPNCPEPVIYCTWSPISIAGVAFPTKYALFKMLAMTGWINVRYFTKFKPQSSTVLLTCEKKKVLEENKKDGLEIGGSTV